MTYSETVQFLYDLRLFGAKFGLDNTLKLAALAGQPQNRLRFIHVAGTNGKGSTCAMLESIYRAAGLRVGLFTSPHLVAFGERFQVDRQLIQEADVIRLVRDMRRMLADADWREPTPMDRDDRPGTGGQGPSRSGISPASDSTHPTFFEVITVMALRYFAEQGCDLVIWETGLGGRLDATNIVTPLVSVITNVQFDHQQWLGDTLAQIAGEKAGIIKPLVPVVTTTDVPEAWEVIARMARERQAPLTTVPHSHTHLPPLDTLDLPLRGEHQRLNAALALATVRLLNDQIPVPPPAIRRGLESVSWPGRLQLEKTVWGQAVLLDGAHNPAGAGVLRAALRTEFPHANPSLVLGILRDKDWATMCRILAPLAPRLFLVPVHSQRTAMPEMLLSICREANPVAEVFVCDSLAQALQWAAPDPFLVVTGSLYLVGEALEQLRLAPASAAGERGLNEWWSLGAEAMAAPRCR